MHCARLVSVQLASPIGELILETCENGVHKLKQSAVDDSNFNPEPEKAVRILSDKNESCAKVNNIHEENCINWLKVYFTDVNATKNMVAPKFCFSEFKGGRFREHVWNSLAEKITSGNTISYGELAALSGSPGAAQSAGTAMATNPIQLIIPCHRVVRNDGSVGNYASGRKNKVKHWLLNYEGVKINDKGFLVKK